MTRNAILLTLAVWMLTSAAQAAEPNRGTPAAFLYLIGEFFSPYFAKGTRVVIEQCWGPFLAAALLAACYLKRRNGNQ